MYNIVLNIYFFFKKSVNTLNLVRGEQKGTGNVRLRTLGSQERWDGQQPALFRLINT